MNPPELPKEFLQDYQCIPTDGPSQMDLAKEWVAGLVAEKILTEHQGQSLLSSHVAVTGSDGRSYGLSFDPIKPILEDLSKKQFRFRSDDLIDELDPSPPMESQMQPRLNRPANSIFIISTPQDITQSLVARRLHLRLHTPPCPACGCTDQIQLKDWFITPAEWKCRICKNKWSYEPTSPRPTPP
jgi:hypothetical protein